ncbi:hypothetical protein LTS08_002825 [Lithohypha guttulata]|uniref:uncharacterized protein n=1 Tax=Lithohypha guttulata TaxID=1690604 RepID=UPI002DDE6D56|nr:hypothetical protein LTS08_002825 [Lithohypha guttulata]
MAPSTNAESALEYILLVLKHTDLPRSDWAAVAVESSLSNANKAHINRDSFQAYDMVYSTGKDVNYILRVLSHPDFSIVDWYAVAGIA